MPEDIIVFARLNKFFRNLLMRHSAVYIWCGAMHNVLKLPPCPPDMCEPQYLALIYLLTCSVSGFCSHTWKSVSLILMTIPRCVARVVLSEWTKFSMFACVFPAVMIGISIYYTSNPTSDSSCLQHHVFRQFTS